MDSEAARKKRLEEIEAKRKRIEEMRKTRAAGQDTTPSANIVTPEVSSVNTQDTDALVSALLKTSLSQPAVSIDSAATPASSTITSDSDTRQERIKKLVVFKNPDAVVFIPSKESVKYDKECQTDNDGTDNSNKDDDIQDEPTNFDITRSLRKSIGQRRSVSEENTPIAIEDVAMDNGAKIVAKQKQFNEFELQTILADKSFSQFLSIASLRVEKELEFVDSFDSMRNYSSGTANIITKSSKSEVFNELASYDDETLKLRPVMYVQASPLINELFLTCHGLKSTTSIQSQSKGVVSAANDEAESANGLVCIWSKELHRRPEIRLVTVSPVLVALFHPNESNLVIGGCYNGQLVVWDIRSGKYEPVAKSNLTGKGHKYPVYCMAMSCSTLSNEVTSISVDGTICQWDISRLTEPKSMSNILFSSPSQSLSASNHLAGNDGLHFLMSPQFDKSNVLNGVNVSAMVSGTNETVNFIVLGSGTGKLMKTPLPYKFNDPTILQADAHYGLVTSLHLHPHSNNSKFKHLLLTSSLDWTVKLWTVNDFTRPLFEFYNPICDYICDVQWSPVHPGLFVTITSSGRLCLWNLCKSTTEPVDIMCVIKDEQESSAASASGGSIKGAVSAVGNIPVALNKAVWSKDGQNVLIGDSVGKVHCIHISSRHTSPNIGDESKLEMLFSANHIHSNEVFSIDGIAPIQSEHIQVGTYTHSSDPIL